MAPTLRILHIVEASFAGVGRHVLDLAQAQIDAGHEVHVVYSPLRESHDFQGRRESMAEVQWHRLRISRTFNQADYRAFRVLRGMVARLQPDVIHGHSTKGGLLARAMPTSPWRIVYTPNAVYSMNPMLGRAARRLVSLVERFLSRRTDVLIAVSPEEEVHLRLIGVDNDKIHVVPNGIEPVKRANKVAVRVALELPRDETIVGFVGRLDEQKAPTDLLAIYGRLAARHADLHFAVVGDGPLRDELEQSVNPKGPLAGRIHFLGQQPGTWAMSAFDLLVLPSRYEGFPYVLIEAAHIGVPIVTTREANASLLGSGRGMVKTGGSGDVEKLTELCEEALDLALDIEIRPDTRFTAAMMAELTELAYRGEPIDMAARIQTRERVR